MTTRIDHRTGRREEDGASVGFKMEERLGWNRDPRRLRHQRKHLDTPARALHSASATLRGAAPLGAGAPLVLRFQLWQCCGEPLAAGRTGCSGCSGLGDEDSAAVQGHDLQGSGSGGVRSQLDLPPNAAPHGTAAVPAAAQHDWLCANPAAAVSPPPSTIQPIHLHISAPGGW